MGHRPDDRGRDRGADARLPTLTDPGCSGGPSPARSARCSRRPGLRDVAEWDVATLLQTDSPEQYWHLATELTGPVVALMSQVDEAARERIKATAIEAVKAYEVDGKVNLPGMARCIVGTK